MGQLKHGTEPAGNGALWEAKQGFGSVSDSAMMHSSKFHERRIDYRTDGSHPYSWRDYCSPSGDACVSDNPDQTPPTSRLILSKQLESMGFNVSDENLSPLRRALFRADKSENSSLRLALTHKKEEAFHCDVRYNLDPMLAQ